MSEAPRDGRPIFAWNGDVQTVICWGKTAHVPVYGWLDAVWADPQDADLFYPTPTHWRYLPDPPSKQED